MVQQVFDLIKLNSIAWINHNPRSSFSSPERKEGEEGEALSKCVALFVSEWFEEVWHQWGDDSCSLTPPGGDSAAAEAVNLCQMELIIF